MRENSATYLPDLVIVCPVCFGTAWVRAVADSPRSRHRVPVLLRPVVDRSGVVMTAEDYPTVDPLTDCPDPGHAAAKHTDDRVCRADSVYIELEVAPAEIGPFGRCA